MTFNELKEWLSTCPDHKWEVEEIFWPSTVHAQEIADELGVYVEDVLGDGSAVVRFRLEQDEE